jgi:hypothetical protein
MIWFRVGLNLLEILLELDREEDEIERCDELDRCDEPSCTGESVERLEAAE